MKNLFEISHGKQGDHMGHTFKKENAILNFLLLFLGMFLNMQKDMFGYNFSLSDIAAACLMLAFLLLGCLKIEVKTMFFFWAVLIVSLVIGTFYIPEKYDFALSMNTYLSSYMKVIASFLYLTLGINIALQKKEDYVLKGYILMAVIMAIVSMLAIIFKVPVFNTDFFIADERFIGLLNDPNYFAVAQCGCLALLLFSNNMKAVKKIALSLVVIISVIFSASKTGFITMLFLLLLFTLLNITRIKKRNVMPFIVISLSVTALISIYSEKIYVFYLYLLEKYPIVSRITVLFDDNSSAISAGGSSREIVWDGGLAIIRENPILGVGIGNYLNAVKRVVGIDRLAHNTYIQIIAEWGLLLGIILFFVCFYVCLFNFFKGDRRLAIFFMVWLIGSLSISLNNSRIFWMILGFLFTIIFINRREQNDPAKESIAINSFH